MDDSEESDEEKRARKRAERRAQSDRRLTAQTFLEDRTAFLARRFGVSDQPAAPPQGFFQRARTGGNAGAFAQGRR